ncbi:sugar ABC transporter ATP-binding protein [Treponema primitia]|uniref:sugar ABC transporter ATP-binding protein n=1 Tax=Treponema primitia TaxID=88058 RepID=UPI000255547C|nr:sugar ABC transporter ATP-binding protein [Treponema primitia]
MGETVLEILDVTKSFPGIMALKGVSFSIKTNTVHCIVGENGAGKSTLIKILAGAERYTGGRLLLKGKEYCPATIREAMECGVSVLFQELNVIEQLTVEENMTLGNEKNTLGILRKSDETKNLKEILHRIDPDIAMNSYVSALSVGEKQILQIAKAIALNAEILILDEPTAALSEDETRRLFDVVETLKKQGITLIYISHKLEEIFKVGDFVTVLLDGHVIKTAAISDLNQEELVKLMLGKVVSEKYINSDIDMNHVIMSARGITNHLLKDVSFDLHQGEIFGFYGLLGAGKTEMARAIAGIDTYSGEIEMFGKNGRFSSPREAYKNGICIVPEERRTQGLVSSLSIRENITLTNAKKISSFGIRSVAREKQIANGYIKKLNIACRNEEQGAAFLSGGNQQKVVFAKCLNADIKIMLLDEPTRGVDMGAKEEIHNIVRDLVKTGNAVIVFSSELLEVLNLCDRIAVLFDGALKAVIRNEGEKTNAEKIMHLALGGVSA